MTRGLYQQLVELYDWRAKLRKRPRNGMLVRALQDIEDRITLFEEVFARTGKQKP